MYASKARPISSPQPRHNTVICTHLCLLPTVDVATVVESRTRTCVRRDLARLICVDDGTGTEVRDPSDGMHVAHNRIAFLHVRNVGQRQAARLVNRVSSRVLALLSGDEVVRREMQNKPRGIGDADLAHLWRRRLHLRCARGSRLICRGIAQPRILGAAALTAARACAGVTAIAAAHVLLHEPHRARRRQNWQHEPAALHLDSSRVDRSAVKRAFSLNTSREKKGERAHAARTYERYLGGFSRPFAKQV